MIRQRRISWLAPAVLIALITALPAFGQGGRGGRGMMGDGAQAADMQLFHQLFAHRSEITRNVVMRPDGIETVTESMNLSESRVTRTSAPAGAFVCGPDATFPEVTSMPGR